MRIAVVGGGAAGLAAAVSAARTLETALSVKGSKDSEASKSPVAEVVVFEADERVGRSILATGNGRCNFSNRFIGVQAYSNAPFVEEVFSELEKKMAFGSFESSGASGSSGLFGPSGSLEAQDFLADSTAGFQAFAPQNAVLRFFDELGFLWREEAEGRLYPATGKASTVLDVLRAELSRLGVYEACGRKLVRIDAPQSPDGLYHLRFSDSSVEHAALVIVAIGGVHAQAGFTKLQMQNGSACAQARAAFRSERMPGDKGNHAKGKRDAFQQPRDKTDIHLVEGQPVKPLLPVLVPLAISESTPRVLNNIRVKARLTLLSSSTRETSSSTYGDVVPSAVKTHTACSLNANDLDAVCVSEEGELLFREYGVSGICVFNLSRFAKPGDTLLIDFLPSMSSDECKSFLLARLQRLKLQGSVNSDADVLACGKDLLRGVLLPAVIHEVLKKAKELALAGDEPEAMHKAVLGGSAKSFQEEAVQGAKGAAKGHLKDASIDSLENTGLLALVSALKSFPLSILGVGDARQCQVMRGGFDLSAFETHSLESRVHEGLFAAGEALDVDAPCGGYNLHWAWASGLLAGHSAALKLCQRNHLRHQQADLQEE